MATDGEVIRFCEGGCTAQGLFLGDIDDETARLRIELPKGDIIGNLTFASVELSFVDVDGGESNEVNKLLDPRRLKGAGIALNTTAMGRIRNPRFVEVSMQKRLEHVKDTMVARIGRCAHAAVDEEGIPYCPALSKEVFEALVEGQLQPRASMSEYTD